ncbi:hypothetical protein WN943_017063 [Citrus x changshan-huyou]
MLSVSLWSLALPSDHIPSSRSIIKGNTQRCSFPQLWLPQQQNCLLSIWLWKEALLVTVFLGSAEIKLHIAWLVGHFNFEVLLSSILLRMQFAATDRLTTDLFGGPLAKGSWGFLSRIKWARTGCWSAQVQQQN